MSYSGQRTLDERLGSACDMMRRLLEQSKRELRRKERQLEELTDHLQELQGETPPDKAAIATAEKRIELLKIELENDRISMSTLEEVIRENC